MNVRVACDGEEEIGGSSIVDLLRADERGAAVCVIFDSGMPEIDVPAFESRDAGGLAYFHVGLRTGERDLHSGIYGGAALNAVHALMQTLSVVVAVPVELREGVAPPTPEELAAGRARSGPARARAGWGHCDKPGRGRRVLSPHPRRARGRRERHTRRRARPPEDRASVTAHANVSIRIAPGQDGLLTAAAFRHLLRAAVPPGAVLEIEQLGDVSEPSLVAPDARAVVLAQDAFERSLGRRPLLLRSGGTLPIMPALMQKGIPTILTGFAVPGNNIHSPNERLLARYIPLGIETARELLTAFGALGG